MGHEGCAAHAPATAARAKAAATTPAAPCLRTEPARRPCDGRLVMRHGPRVGLDAGHGSGHAQSTSSLALVFAIPTCFFYSSGKTGDFQTRSRWTTSSFFSSSQVPRVEMALRLAFLRGGVARYAQRRRQHGHVDRAVGGH